MPKKIKTDYPDLPNSSVICESCRKFYNEQENSRDVISYNSSTTLESIESDSPATSSDVDAQADLNDILNGLKNKF